MSVALGGRLADPCSAVQLAGFAQSELKVPFHLTALMLSEIVQRFAISVSAFSSI